MPYQPTQRDISGQLRGEGIAAMGKGIGEGFAEGIQAYQQNKTLASQAISKFEALLSANPELREVLNTPTAPQEAFKAFSKLQKDGALGARDASFLAQYAESFTAEKEAMQKQKMQQMQMEMYSAQMQQMKAAQDAAKRAEDQEKKNLEALRTAMSPASQEQPKSPMEAFITPKTKFQDIPRGLSTVRPPAPPSIAAPKTASDAMTQFLEAGGMPTAQTNQMFNVMADREVALGAVAQRAAKAEQDKTTADTRAEAEKTRALAAEARSEQRPPYGKEEQYTANGKTRTAVYDGRAFVDKETRQPLFIETRDMLGNITTVPNPVLYGETAQSSPFRIPQVGGGAANEFATPQEAEAARRAGQIKNGDPIVVGGVPGKWRD